MGLDGIYAAVSGLRVSQRRLEQSSHNLANASTPGYQPRRVEQADVAGGGVRVTGTSPSGPAGPVVATEQPLDLAINGGGFFVLDDGQGGRLYTRAGNFTLNADGELVDPLGRRVLAGGMEVPPQAEQVRVGPDGNIQALAGDGTVLAEGQIQTAVFGNPGGLESVGGNAFRETPASGPPVMAAPGAPGHGELVSGALQSSGTDLAREMVNQIVDQRTFEANVKTVQTYDDMVGAILDVKG